LQAAVCRWGLCPCCPGVGRYLSRVNNQHHHKPSNLQRGFYRFRFEDHFGLTVRRIHPAPAVGLIVDKERDSRGRTVAEG